jgi:hypothetical protein
MFMSSRKLTRLFVALSALVAASCAVERPTINRVQPNALSKSFFVGNVQDSEDNPIFLSRNFVVDASESQELVGVSTASGVERIRWEVTEGMLFARRAYSLTGGSDRGTGKEPNGDLIAAYEIESHFDLRNAYNPATGEELNIQEENTTDRPWNEREHFRVDWSENLVNTPVWTEMFFGKVFGDIKVTPVVYYDNDETSDDAPVIEPEAGYMDVTSHFLVEPEMTRWGNFDFPLCWIMGIFTGSAIYSCDPQEAVLRTSFWRLDKADPDDDFEPFENTDAPQDIIGNPGGIGDSAMHGIITAPLETYDPQSGFTDEGLTRLMLKHDLWEQNHQTVGSCESNKDCEKATGRVGAVCLQSRTCSVPCDYKARTDGNRNGTDDQCENGDTGYDGNQGAQCSLRDRCTIPVRDRDVQTLTYYLDPDMPEDLQDKVNSKGKVTVQGANEQLIGTWNQALQQAVATAREVECRRTASHANLEAERDSCHSKYFEVEGNGKDQIQMVQLGGWGLPTPRKLGDVLVLCHNPVRDYDDPACGAEGDRFRQGDIRKNMLIYWNYNTQAPFGGIGAWRADPATGQIVGAAATTIGRSATQSAGRVRDLVLVALGEFGLDEITGGASASLFQKALRDGHAPETPLTQNQLAERVAQIDLDRLHQSVPLNLSSIDPQMPAKGIAAFRSSLGPDPGQAGKELLRFQAAAEPLLGSEFEAEMVNGAWIFDAVGANPTAAASESTLDMTSPLRSYDMGALAAGDQRLIQALGQRGVCYLDKLTTIGTPEIRGLGQFYRTKYSSLTGTEFAQQVYEDLWVEIYKGIQLHEIGHSLGLLHNFTSSWDSANYDPQYWQLRTHEGTSTASCSGAVRAGGSDVSQDSCMGPRYLDPLTTDEMGIDSEARPGLNYYAHTSTMEYQNARFFETIGLGQYDVMAMKVLYGRVLETMDKRNLTPLVQSDMLSLNETQRSEDWPVYNVDFQFPVAIHYTELARRLQVFDPARCRDATDAEKATAEWRIVHGKVCAPPPKDHAHWDDFVHTASVPTAIEGSRVRVAPEAATAAAGNTRWPYRFGGDMMNAYMHVNPFDSGADPYEATIETIRKNEYNYPLTYFRAKRRGWTDINLPSFMARQFYERLRAYHWSISFTNAFYTELVEQVPGLEGIISEWRNSDDVMRPGLLAQTEMFNGIASVLMAPEPGQYHQQEPGGTFFDLNTRGVSSTAETFVVDTAVARYLAPSYDSGPNAGGSWDYLNYAVRAGYEVEKALAARALTDGRPVFNSFSRDIFLDDRITNINFRNDVPQAVDRLLGGLLSAQWPSVSPYVTSASVTAGDPLVTVPDLISEAPTLPAGARQVFPNFGYNQSIPTLVFSHLYGRLNGDLELSNKLRIWVQGNISAELDIPEAEQQRFTNPESGVTYVARRFGRETVLGASVDKGIGSRMLETANELLLAVYEVEVDEEGNTIYDEFGRAELARNEAGSPIRRDDELADAAHTKLSRYIGQLDATVQISNLVGYGPFNAR